MMAAFSSINTSLMISLLFKCLFLCTLTSLVKASNIFLGSQESDRVINLPGQPPNPSVSQFSGYITVNQNHGRALFYWFFEAQSHPSEKPLLLWLNGGPGCSSIGLGAASELGPLRVDINGSGLLFNQYAWNHEVNLLFVESPVGVGFSYTNTSSDLSKLDDVFTAEDAYNFVVNWLERFPQYKNHDFFVAGESYAGHYVPQLAELVYDRNNDTTKYPFIHLKGFIVGNPETDDFYDNTGMLEYAWSHAVISDQLYEEAKRACHFEYRIWSAECDKAMYELYESYDEIDITNIYAPKCLINDTSSSAERSQFIFASLIKNRKMRIPGGYDPCYFPYATQYFNRADVQSALHAARGNGTITWQACTKTIFREYNISVSSVLRIYTKLIKGGLRIWVYSGDVDGRVPVIGTRYWVEALNLTLRFPWRSWYHHHQVAGRIVEYEGLSFITVRGAGHLVPLSKPEEALLLLRSFLAGEELPKNR